MARQRTSGARLLVNVGVICVLIAGVVLIAKFAGSMFIPLLGPRIPSLSQGDPRGLSGVYVATSAKHSGAKIELRPDHTATVRGLAGLDGLGRRMGCSWNGEAQWWSFKNALALKMTPLAGANHSTCPGHWVNYGFDIVGPKAPYQLTMYMGYFVGRSGAVFDRVQQ